MREKQGKKVGRKNKRKMLGGGGTGRSWMGK